MEVKGHVKTAGRDLVGGDGLEWAMFPGIAVGNFVAR